MKRLSERTWHTLRSESGQTSILIMLTLSIFVMGTMAFGVDFANIWFHRQAAQGAADSACIAGATDMLLKAGGVTPSAGGFTPGTASDCKASSSAPVCSYAKFNGFDGSAGLSATAQSQSVSWTFPTSVSGITTPPSAVIAHPFLRVSVQENVKTWFMALLGKQWQQVGASCTCGTVNIASAPPILLLNPTGTLTFNGGGTSGGITILGGPIQSVQINSGVVSSVTFNGSHAGFDTSQAGPNFNGGNVGVTGKEADPGTSNFVRGTNGMWLSPDLPIPNPFASLIVPTNPGPPAASKAVAWGQDGCPDTGGCTELFPGAYAGISMSGTKILSPGFYYLTGDLGGNGGDVRPAVPGIAAGTNPYAGTPPYTGVTLYFKSGGINFKGLAGTSTTLTKVPLNWMVCSGQTVPAKISAVVTPLNGSVLWAPCTTNATFLGGGSSDTFLATGNRGIVIYTDPGNDTSFSFKGNGGISTIGTIYAHATDYGANIALGGNGTSGSIVYGEIVADNLSVANGNGAVNMWLSTNKTTNILKVSIFQ